MVQDKTGPPPTGGGTPHTPDRPRRSRSTASVRASAPPLGRGVRESGRVLMARVAAAVAGGGLLFLAFPPIDWWLGRAARRRADRRRPLPRAPPARRLARLPGRRRVPVPHPGLGTHDRDDVWVMLVGVESLFYAADGRPGRAGVPPAAVAAVVRRALGGRGVGPRAVPLRRLPLGAAGVRQGESLFTQYAALGGAPLVTFAVALCGALLAAALLRRPAAPGRGVRAARPGRARSGRAGLLTLAVPRPGDEGAPINHRHRAGQRPAARHALPRRDPMMILDNHARPPSSWRGHRGGEDAQAGPGALAGELLRPRPLQRPAGVRQRSTDGGEGRRCAGPGRRRWSARTRTTCRTRASSGTRSTGPGAHYTSSTRCRSASTSRSEGARTKVIQRLDRDPAGTSTPAPTPASEDRPGPVGDVICFEVAYDGIVRDTVNGRRPRAGRADQQRHLRPHRPARAAARHVQAARRRARPGRGHRRHQRDQRGTSHPTARSTSAARSSPRQV